MNQTKTAIITLILSSALLLPGPGQCASYPASVEQLVTQARQSVETVNMAQFKSLYDKQAVGLLLDVRDPTEYSAGHIPGAVNVSRGTLEFKLWKLVGGPEHPDYDKQITIYCSVGGRSALAAKALRDLGFTHVMAVNMKLEDWVKAGYPLDEEE